MQIIAYVQLTHVPVILISGHVFWNQTHFRISIFSSQTHYFLHTNYFAHDTHAR